MAGFYLKAYHLLPGFLKRRIYPLEYAIQAFVRSVDLQRRSVIVDAGAGEARFREYFPGHLYVALDSAVGDNDWDYSRINVCGDLGAVPLVSNAAHAVLNLQVLEHVPDPRAVLSEIHRVLKPRGRLYLTAPQGWCEHQQPHDYYRFTRYALRSVLESVGFSEVEVEPMGGYFHYLGHRLTYIPKILFQERALPVRILFFPLELISLVSFCLVGPIACYYLDGLDKKKEFTLCYRCRALKPGTSEVAGINS